MGKNTSYFPSELVIAKPFHHESPKFYVQSPGVSNFAQHFTKGEPEVLEDQLEDRS